MTADKKGKGRALDPSSSPPSLLSPCESLPFEIQHAILHHLSPAELVQVAATSRTLRTIALTDILWKRHVSDFVALSPPPRNPWITPFVAPPTAWQSSFQTPEAPPWSFPSDLAALASALQQDDDDDAEMMMSSDDLARGSQYRGSSSTTSRRSSAAAAFDDSVLTPLHPDRYPYEALRAAESAHSKPSLAQAFPGAHSFYEVYVYFLQPVAHLLGWWASDAPNFGGLMRFVLDLTPEVGSNERSSVPETAEAMERERGSRSTGPTFLGQRLHFTNRLAALDTRARQSFPAVRVSDSDPIGSSSSRGRTGTIETSLWQAITSFVIPAETYLGPPTILRYDHPHTSYNVDVLDPGVRTEKWVEIRWVDVRDRLRAEQERERKRAEAEAEAQAVRDDSQDDRMIDHDEQEGRRGRHTSSSSGRRSTRSAVLRSTRRCWPVHPIERVKESKTMSSSSTTASLPIEEQARLDLDDLLADDPVGAGSFAGWTVDRHLRTPSPPSIPASDTADFQDNVFAFDAHRRTGTTSSRRSTAAEAAPSQHHHQGAVASHAHRTASPSPASSSNESSRSGSRPRSIEEAHALVQQERAAAYGGPWAPLRGSTSVSVHDDARVETYEHILYRNTAAISTGLRGHLDSSRVLLRSQPRKDIYSRANEWHVPFEDSRMGYAQEIINDAGPAFGFMQQDAAGMGPGGQRAFEAMPAAIFPPPGLLHIVRPRVEPAGRSRGGEEERGAFGEWEREGYEVRLDRMQMVPSPPYVCYPHPRLGARPMPSGPRWYPLVGPSQSPPWERSTGEDSTRKIAARMDHWNEPIPASLDPSSAEFDWDSLNGLYAQTYGPHGIEVVYVRSRILTEADFDARGRSVGGEGEGKGKGRRRWDPEPLLSADDMYVDQLIDRDAVRPGARVVEATKVTGDPNVPRGQVTWRAFVSDPSIRRTAWRPPKAGYRHHLPWPFVEATSSRGAAAGGGGGGHGGSVLAGADGEEEEDEDGDVGRLHHPGLVGPAHGRVAGEGFAGAAWASAMVLIAPHEIRVWWQPMMKCAVARKLYGM
ncbi:hypothetical protein CF319_g5211 [Tilletia indica]|nr:hypothetical protein CF319_g5211 [Tilletia indica]